METVIVPPLFNPIAQLLEEFHTRLVHRIRHSYTTGSSMDVDAFARYVCEIRK
jgi:hypothetical protein